MSAFGVKRTLLQLAVFAALEHLRLGEWRLRMVIEERRRMPEPAQPPAKNH